MQKHWHWHWHRDKQGILQFHEYFARLKTVYHESRASIHQGPTFCSRSKAQTLHFVFRTIFCFALKFLKELLRKLFLSGEFSIFIVIPTVKNLYSLWISQQTRYLSELNTRGRLQTIWSLQSDPRSSSDWYIPWLRKNEILAKFLQDVWQDLARECIILAEISKDLVKIVLILQVTFKILMFLTRFLLELPWPDNIFLSHKTYLILFWIFLYKIVVRI